ncbi:uncharacterized protein N7458_003309 [Penicillium daleae]|uniref:Uncharacterized protein n=1 Tax=Penicillium daleae TaxID=63821 RepID=A0AAD6CEN8_9EURO|nr:uncharacterized protein N7458_003309 [Penicillium daleae]KAJ5461757.1 hypothetical protein N7458_003309 [Penicillium daleae]
MERKLSQKALRMRQRFTFSRGRDRASTIPPSGATSTPSTRPRSATTPISSHSNSTIHPTYYRTSTDHTRYFHFTDEPGYFRPDTPLIDRQSVPEELEDDVKHACALLVQSVDRGLPIWPSFQSEHRPNTTTAKVSSPIAPSRFYYQGVSMSPAAVDNQIAIPVDKTHDSGVAFQQSVTSAATGRFYGSQISTSRPEQSQEDAQRGQSFNTDATPVSRSRSRSLSPDMFPYSPPQVDTLWPHVKDISFQTSDALFADTDADPEKETDVETHLGVEGMTWLRASLDIARIDSENPPITININVTTMPVVAPRRFYSTRQPRASERGYGVVGATWDGSHSRTPSVDDADSVQSFSSAEDGARRFYQPQRSVSSGGLQQGDEDRVYAIVSGGGQRRRKASLLLRKLAGLGRKKDGDGLESRRVVVAV